MRKRMLLFLIALIAALVAPTLARADMVTRWNATAADVLMTQAGQAPNVSVLHMAMVHGAVYDAVNSIDGRYEGYLLDRRLGSPLYSQDAAAAAAAHRMLVSILTGGPGPNRSDLVPAVDAEYTLSLLTVPDGPAKERGIAVGEAAAAVMIAARTGDGRYGPYRFPIGFEPGVWHPPFPPFTTTDPNAWVKDVRPFLVQSASQFRPKGPYPLDSHRYAKEFDEVKALGAANSTVRTPAQTNAARYWAENPPRTWSRITRGLVVQEGLSLAENARLFAMIYMTVADTFITVWDAKAYYSFWRPTTAIREADTDGNTLTDPDPAWTPLIANPPYSEHPSGHLGLSASFVLTLQEALRHKAVGWQDTNAGGQTTSYSSLSEALDEIVEVRIWSGIHFRNADETSVKVARAIANYRDAHYFGKAHGWHGRR